VEFGTYEPPRGFESIFVGMLGEEIPVMAGRICGICYSAHTITAAQAIEDAWGYTPPEDAVKIREILLLANLLQSHTLHFAFLAMPDMVCDGDRNFIGVFDRNKQFFNASLGIRRIAQKITEILGGRRIHPATVIPGGVTKDLGKSDIQEMERMMEESRDHVDILKRFTIEVIEKNSDFFRDYDVMEGNSVCLQQGDSLTLDRSMIGFQEDGTLKNLIQPGDFAERIKERTIDYSFTKRPYFTGFEHLYRVGPLPRVNHCNWDNELLEIFDKTFHRPSRSTLAYNIARIIEIEEAIKRIESIIFGGIGKRLREPVKPRSGSGISVTEAPRGILFHNYVTDEEGVVKKAKIITPTEHNAHAIERSAEAVARKYLSDKVPQEITPEDLNIVEMVVRAYDPCISCSVHLSELKEVNEDREKY
jgi:F420-non-reducing hydrogenase large subunit